MQKWIIASLLGLIMQGSPMVGTLVASQYEGSIQAGEKLKTEGGYRSQSFHCNKPGPTGPAGHQGPPGGGGFERYASYWLTNQPSLVSGQNILFNLQQRLKGIDYDSTTGIFTLPPGVYAINFFGTPNNTFDNTLNLNVNGTIIPTPGLEGSMIVIELSETSNQVTVQATGNWDPQTGGIGSYFFAYASIAIYQIGSEVTP